MIPIRIAAFYAAINRGEAPKPIKRGKLAFWPEDEILAYAKVAEAKPGRKRGEYKYDFKFGEISALAKAAKIKHYRIIYSYLSSSLYPDEAIASRLEEACKVFRTTRRPDFPLITKQDWLYGNHYD